MKCSKDFSLTVDSSCLITTSSPLPSGTVGVAYSETIAATGISGTLAWTITSGSLPDGLSLNGSTGEISGTPITEESSSFTIEVSNGTIHCTKDFSLTIDAADICGATPASVQDAIWTEIGPNPPCNSFVITAGVCSSWFETKNITTCLSAGASSSTTICNPGANYLITVTIPWDSNGNVGPSSSFLVNFILLIDGIQVDSQSNDIRFAPFTQTLTGLLTTGTHTMQINITPDGAIVPAPQYQVISNGNLTITPLTPP